ncbi:MAG: hypothetical protein MJA30_04340, partial [Cytophagales bacterium]|nr:hypothetical protein [Cytophagales bacterium]
INSGNMPTLQSCPPIFLMFISDHIPAIVFVQPAGSANPQEPILILNYSGDGMLGQLLINGSELYISELLTKAGKRNQEYSHMAPQTLHSVSFYIKKLA